MTYLFKPYDGEVKNDSGNPLPVSKDTSLNSSSNRIYVDTGLTIPAVFDGEIKNDAGNPIPISKNTDPNSSDNPLAVEWVYGDGATIIPWQVQVARGKIAGITGLSISGTLTMGGGGNGAATFNVPNNLTITNFSTYFQSATNSYALNNNTISITGSLTINMFNNYGVTGTTTLKMIGTGNLTYGSTNTGNFITNPFTIDTLGTITITGTINPLFSGSTIFQKIRPAITPHFEF
jgi:hypothetical protein